MAFPYKKGLREEIVAKGEPVDSGISTTAFPMDFRDPLVAKYRDFNEDPNKVAPRVFGEKESTEFLNEKFPTFDNNPNFADVPSNLRAKDFLEKYKNSFIQPPEEKVSAASIKDFILGGPNTNLAKKYPETQELS